MHIPTIYLTIAGEVFLVLLFIVTIYIFLQTRDKKNLLSYVENLKEKVTKLKQKLIEHEEMPNPVQELLEETIEHVKTDYEQTFGHEIGSETSASEDNSKEHFTFILGYQTLKAELSAIQNSRTAAKTWDKIVSQLGPLIDNFRAQPEKVIQTETAEAGPISSTSSKAVTTAAKVRGKPGSLDGNAEISSVRRGEIERLKGQIASQFEEIFNLQSQISSKATSSNNPMADEVNEGLESITRQLKDAELCITMMDAEIQTANEEILDLKEQLENSGSANSGDQNDLAIEVEKKNAFIDRTIQENKEMVTLIEGMEKHSDEQAKQISQLEAELKQLHSAQ